MNASGDSRCSFVFEVVDLCDDEISIDQEAMLMHRPSQHPLKEQVKSQFSVALDMNMVISFIIDQDN